jgi:uncharacterized protein (TIGR02757 family)
VRYVHRYTERADREVAAALAAGLAFGRVASFGAVLDRVFALLDAHGGPAAAARRVPEEVKEGLAPMFYRWVRGPDLAAFLGGVGRAQARPGGLEAMAGRGDAKQGLIGLAEGLRAGVEEVTDTPWAEQSRGLRYLAVSPASGSASKRMCMWMRWMVRPADGIDLGLWRRDPATLVVPVDTHVLRVSRFVGLTERRDGSWRTAVDITASLRRLDPADPVRFDFVLAHLGISGACRGHRDPEVCPGCPLDPVCAAPLGISRGTASR